MPKRLQIRAFALLCVFAGAALPLGAQEIVDGLDDPAWVGPFTTEANRTFPTTQPLPSGLWTYDTTESQVGGDSVVSTLPPAAISRLKTSVQGPATVSFRWKTQGDTIIDFLKFRVEGQLGSLGAGGVQDWDLRTFEVDCGLREIEWEFERLGSSSQNNGKAWLDELVVTPIPNRLDLQEALENSELEIYSNLSKGWVKDGLDGAQNGFAAKSDPGLSDPAFGEGGISTMMFEVQGPATIAFKWGLSTHPDDFSELQFRVNDSIVSYLAGSHELHESTLDVGPGVHCVKFLFIRDGFADVDYELPIEGYVDHLVVTPIEANPALAAAMEWTQSSVYSNAWTPQTLVTRDGVDAAAVTAPEVNRWRRLYIELPDGPGLLSFWTRLDIASGNAALAVDLDRNPLMESSVAHGWKKTEINLKGGTDRVLEALFVRSDSVDSTSARAYLDLLSFLPGVTNYQPDLAIRPRGKPIRGVGIHNPTGLRQVAVARPKLRRPQARFLLQIENKSPTDKDRIRIRGTGNRRQFEVLFVVRENGKLLNFTSAFLSGRFSTLELPPKGRERHQIWITPKRRSKARTHHFRATGRSSEDATKVDAVRTRVILPRR